MKNAYAKAGVDVGKAERFIEEISGIARATRIFDEGQKRELPQYSIRGDYAGGFGMRIPPSLEETEVLFMSTTDGIGTKSRYHACVKDGLFRAGIDLVAVCVNDLICTGARPISFMNYYGTSMLDIEQGKEFIKGVAYGCKEAECAIVGGETAEMPNHYADGNVDLVGFASGCVRAEDKLPGCGGFQDGDYIVGVPSSGLHCNGFSLLRKYIPPTREEMEKPCPWNEDLMMQDELLATTHNYVKPVMELLEGYEGCILGMAHVSGGGLARNIPRALGGAEEFTAVIDRLHDVRMPEVYRWLNEEMGVSPQDMFDAFNCGIGMVFVVDRHYMDVMRSVFDDFFNKEGSLVRIGHIERGKESLRLESELPIGKH